MNDNGANSAHRLVDTSAFVVAWETVKPALCAKLSADTRLSREDVEDLLQETVLKAWRARHQYRGGSLTGWFVAISRSAKRLLITVSRSTSRTVRLDDGRLTPVEDRGLDSRTEDDVELLRDLLADINSLPARRRTIFLMYAVDEYNAPSIAGRLGLSVNTVWSTIRAAQRDLRRMQAMSVTPSLGEKATAAFESRRFCEASHS